MTTRVLITGGTGLLGHALIERAPAEWEVMATFHHLFPSGGSRVQFYPLDICDDAAVTTLLDAVRPDVVIHTASVGSVEEAQQNPQAVRAVNVGGIQAIGRACACANARLVFISSNAVFDGTCPLYREEDAVHAVNQYGMIKIEAERWVQQECRVPWAIIRPILLYGWPVGGGRGNVVTRWLNEFEHGRIVDVDASLWSMPLWVASCADVIWAVAAQGRTGIYHAAGADRLPLIEFARQVARVFGYGEQLVRPASAAFLAQFAPRPKDTSFAITKMQEELGVRAVGTQDGLTAMLKILPMGVRSCAS